MKARARSRGVAVVTALLVVAIAASAATFMLAQQSAMLNQAALIAARAQADLHARTGLDWARGVLTEDLKATGLVDALNEGWAQPIAAFPVDRALVAGNLTDEQARFNLNNLVKSNAKSEPDVAIFQRLLESLQLPPELAFAVVDWIDPDSDLAGPAGAEDNHYLALERPYRAANQPLVQVEELHRIRGFDARAVARLRPYVTVLPVRTTVNVNTAPLEVLQAILPATPPGELTGLIARRAKLPVRTAEELRKALPQADGTALGSDLGVRSGYFLARVSVAQDDVQLGVEALLRREDNGATAIIWRRPLY